MAPVPLSPLDLPLVLEEIGTHLKPSDLYACALVSRHWNTYFAPFLYWLALEDCDAIAQRLYDINIARPLKLGKFANVESRKKFDPNYRLQVDYLSHVDALVKKIDHSSSSSAMHRRARRTLRCESLMSFILLGTLCDNVREIFLTLRSSSTLADPRPEVDPEVYTMSRKHLLTQERPDRVVQVLERCARLERLVLKDRFTAYGAYYQLTRSARLGHWRDVRLPLTAPRWPNLKLVELHGCTLDGSFLRILFINAPILKILRLTEISIRTTSDPNADLGFLDPHPDAHPALEELLIFRPDIYPIGMQLELARLQPKLKTLQITYEQDSGPPLFFAPGFHALEKLRVHTKSSYSIAPVVQAANRLGHLWVEGKVVIDEAMALGIKRHSWTLTTLTINCLARATWQPVSNNGAENPLHLILRSCHALKSCTMLNPSLDCNPAEFDRPWVCNEIEHLIILPNCEPKDIGAGQTAAYTSFQAQAALYLQLSRLKSLKTLGFGGGVGSRSFYVEEHLEMLCGLDQLEVLHLHSQDLDSNAQVTVEHAVLVTNHWPRLKAIQGLYHFVCKPFVEYVKTHRPDLDLSY
ncbi:hypothetical protein BGZ68_006626 [Mortierella alpina]|nr:hypothetical protein BGZ68_006626 [Mortierella alpina]